MSKVLHSTVDLMGNVKTNFVKIFAFANLGSNRVVNFVLLLWSYHFFY